MVPAKGIATLMRANIKAYIKKHGRLDLLPKRKEPLSQQMIEGMLLLPQGTLINKQHIDWSAHFWMHIKALMALLASTGQRKSEALLPDEAEWDMSRASRAQIVWLLQDEEHPVVDPTAEQMSNLRRGDVMLWIPGSSKADYGGLKWAPSPVPMRWDDEIIINTPREMAQIEVHFPTHGEERSRTPLFTTEPDSSFPMRFKHVERLLQPMLRATMLVGAEEAKQYSWHSFRIFLATALKASGAEDWEVQHALRWATPAMVKVYARRKQSVQEDLLEQVLTKAPTFDMKQTPNLLKGLDLDDYHVPLGMEEMAAAVTRLDIQ
jgi:hypothetical protein